MWIVLVAMVVSTVIGVLLGILISFNQKVASIVLYAAGVIMTVPSIALFAFMIPLLGLGFVPAVVGLILYTQLPILRNTYIGLNSVDPAILEAAKGLGMTPRRILFRVKLPLAFPVIMAGIRTSVVMGIGIASIAAYIGSGGLGELIFRGISRTDMKMVLSGAILISIFSLIADYSMSLIERRVSKGT
ncbi:MAG: ABC transporter permease [Firmicutes bacterium]|nr:ABC transporter permease [Bacillota bacterium]